MKSPLPLLPGERILFSSPRAGNAGHGVGWWLLAIFVGLQISGGFMFVLISATVPSEGGTRSGAGSSILAVVVGAVALGRWIQLRTQPSYFVTSQRIVARRFFLPAVSLEPGDVGAAARFLIRMMRYGRVVSETLTESIVIAKKSGGTLRFGPVKDAETMLVILEGLAQGVIDVRALPGKGGELSAAESRRDLFFARATKTAGAERGPLFVGATTVIGFAAELPTSRMLQLYTIVGAERSPEDIEERMIALARNTEFGRAVVMKREGTTLKLGGKSLILASEQSQVAFDLSTADAARAALYLPAETHPYR